MALNDKTIDPDVVLDARIVDAIRTRLDGGRLPCAAAHAAAEALGVEPIEVGRTADQLRIKLTGCQLGLFGLPGRAKGWDAVDAASRAIPEGLEAAVLAARNDRGEVACDQLWREAARFSIDRVHVAWLADRLGIKIRRCQLGAF